jgi:hypothetical protein
VYERAIMAAVRPRLALCLTALVLLGGCGGDDDVACGPVEQEPLDPNSGLHVLPDQEVPEYETSPPTSGAHYASEPPSGVVDEPLDEPMQVLILEIGQVLLQYRDLPEDEVARLEGFADTDGVVVAPNPDLPEPVVATAWVTKQTCSGLDADVIREFVREQRGQGPGA